VSGASPRDLSLNHIVRYNTVQEQANTNWSAYVGPCVVVGPAPFATAPQVRFRFTDWSAAILILAGDRVTERLRRGCLSERLSAVKWLQG